MPYAKYERNREHQNNEPGLSAKRNGKRNKQTRMEVERKTIDQTPNIEKHVAVRTAKTKFAH